jgi:ABC-2 type transport system ATP-binding protein
MTTILEPTSGKVFVDACDVTKDEGGVRSSIGYFFQDSTLDEDLTAYENLYYHSVLYKVPKKKEKRKFKNF